MLHPDEENKLARKVLGAVLGEKRAQDTLDRIVTQCGDNVDAMEISIEQVSPPDIPDLGQAHLYNSITPVGAEKVPDGITTDCPMCRKKATATATSRIGSFFDFTCPSRHRFISNNYDQRSQL
jgi:hypothetical protein